MNSSSTILKFLERFLPPEIHHLIGDIEEEFHQNKEDSGTAKAGWIFWYQLIRALPYFIFETFTWNTTMLKNYLVVGWRNLKKHTSFSFINILGLAASLAVCLLMILFLIDQKSYDRFHPDGDRIVRIISEIGPTNGDGPAESYAVSPLSLARILEEQYPEVEKAVQISGHFQGGFSHSGPNIGLSGLYTEPEFLSLFGFELLQGDPQTALEKPGSVILTQESAEKLFGEEPALGKAFRKANDREFTVTGIIDHSQKTHIDFEMIGSYSTITADPELTERFDNWKNTLWDSYTYLLLKENVDAEAFQQKIQEQIELAYTEDGSSRIKQFVVQPITKINLSSGKYNEIGMVLPGIISWFLIGFTGVIMLIACFNYVSLTVARALNRSKEVGVRKVHGAYRSSVIKQFITEAVMIALFALLFAIFIVRWLIPGFNSLFVMSFLETRIDASMLFEPYVLAIFVLFSVLVGVFAGFYPSLYLSSFKPAQVLKGIAHSRGISGQMLKKIITIGQFSFSIIFITTSLILFLQFRHLVNTDYGFDQESVVNISLYDVSYEVLRDKLLQDPSVQSVAAANLVPAMGNMYTMDVSSDTHPTEIESQSIRVDEQYIQTMGLNLMAGRNFNPEMHTDSSSSIIISTKLASRLGFDSPRSAVNQQISVDDKEKKVTIIGVIQNFISVDPLSSDDATVLLYEPERATLAVVKTRPGKTSTFISGLEETWKSLGSPYSLNYSILDDELRENPSLVVFVDFIKVLGLVATFSIFISCLGLLGLAIYSAENRVKEIGIRKVLGASVHELIFTLSKEYLWMISIAVLISIPLGWLLNSLWLDMVSNKAPFGFIVYVAGAVIAIILALFTITTQACRAARSNPVRNLRSE